jgi:hypothetical protein
LVEEYSALPDFSRLGNAGIVSGYFERLVRRPPSIVLQKLLDEGAQLGGPRRHVVDNPASVAQKMLDGDGHAVVFAAHNT